MIIRNGQVFEEDGTFSQRDVYVENHRIVGSESKVSDKTVLDAQGLLVLPGFIDIHSHGAVGYDFSDGDPEGLKEILRFEKRSGVTSWCPTSMALSPEKLREIFSTVKEAEKTQDGSKVPGLNMEGPFLDEKKRGAHEARYIIPPDVDLFRELNEVSGNRIKLVTLAPNTPGALDFIDQLKGETCISLGHTGADYETCRQALHRGAHHVTHLYNAMTPLGHREPGLPGAAFDDPECMVELISDGIHVHPSVVRWTFAGFGPERVILISDSMMAAGMENGRYTLGGQDVSVRDGKAVLEDGTIAGSAVCLSECVRRAVSFGIPIAEAIFAATRNPAVSIGIYDRTGSITPGKEADIILTTPDLQVRQVL